MTEAIIELHLQHVQANICGLSCYNIIANWIGKTKNNKNKIELEIFFHPYPLIGFYHIKHNRNYGLQSEIARLRRQVQWSAVTWLDEKLFWVSKSILKAPIPKHRTKVAVIGKRKGLKAEWKSAKILDWPRRKPIGRSASNFKQSNG